MALALTTVTACGPLRFPDIPEDGSVAVDLDGSTLRDADADPDDMGSAADASPERRDAESADAFERDATDASPDAAPADAADAGVVPDATEPPDAGAVVTVTIHRDQAPAAGIHVLFQGADGHLISSTMTDSAGQAIGDVGSEGMVTYAEPTVNGRYTLYTVAGVALGDVLELHLPETANVGTVEVSFPGEVSGATSYKVSLGCTGATNPSWSTVHLSVPAGCLDAAGRVSALATAIDQSGALLAYSEVDDIAVTSGSTTAAALSGWRTDFAELAYTAINQPPGFDRIDVLQAQKTAAGTYSSTQQRVTINGAASWPLQLRGSPSLGGSRVVVAALYSNSAPDSSIGTYSVLPAASTSTVVDLAWSNIGTLVFDRFDSAVPTRPVVTWTAPASVAAAGDLTFMMIGWTNPTGIWGIFAPPNATNRFRLPELPSELAASGPSAGSVFRSPVIQVMDFDTVTDFAQIKRLPLPQLTPAQLGRMRWSAVNLTPSTVQ